jgi:hypothetical protein
MEPLVVGGEGLFGERGQTDAGELHGTGVNLHQLAGEGHQPDARVSRVESPEELSRGGHLGGEDGVAGIGASEVRRAARRRVGRQSHHAVSVHVDSGGLAGRDRGVDHDDDVEAAGSSPERQGAPGQEDARRISDDGPVEGELDLQFERSRRECAGHRFGARRGSDHLGRALAGGLVSER